MSNREGGQQLKTLQKRILIANHGPGGFKSLIGDFCSFLLCSGFHLFQNHTVDLGNSLFRQQRNVFEACFLMPSVLTTKLELKRGYNKRHDISCR